MSHPEACKEEIKPYHMSSLLDSILTMERRKYLGLPGDMYVKMYAFYLLCIIRINCVVLRLVMMSYKAQEPLGETLLTVQWVVPPGSSWRSTAGAQLT